MKDTNQKALIYLSDILNRAGLDINKVKLIRHSLNDKHFNACYDKGFTKEYTQLQKNGFSAGYEYWAVFISAGGTSCRLFACYKVNGFQSNTENVAPQGYPFPKSFDSQGAYFDLQQIDLLKDLEGRLVIDWGAAAISWHQKATIEKPVLAIQSSQKTEFAGYENICISFSTLKEIVEDSIVYENWHAALSSVYAIYLITDTKTGKQYIGSAYGKGGLLARWSCYIKTHHGNNQRMIKILDENPEQYQFFQFSILQILPKTITDDEVIELEGLYKDKLQTRQFGMNEN